MRASHLVIGCSPLVVYSLPFQFVAFPPALLPWEISRDGAPRAQQCWKLPEEGGQAGAWWEGGALHKKQISCCCPGSLAHISSLTESAACLQVTSRCFHSSLGAMRAHTTWVWGLLPTVGWGREPCHDGDGGAESSLAPSGMASSSSPSPGCCQVPPPCSQPMALGAASSPSLAALGMSWRQSRF